MKASLKRLRMLKKNQFFTRSVIKRQNQGPLSPSLPKTNVWISTKLAYFSAGRTQRWLTGRNIKKYFGEGVKKKNETS